uniref:Uncharacterized protein n=1 Tax=Manihot esculenta TaxID=3983 RepID=A0A2C9VEG2_MANES
MRILGIKGIYFPHGDFMDANLRLNPSWFWRNLLEGREVLAEDMSSSQTKQ